MITKEDLQNLEVIFANARTTVNANLEQLKLTIQFQHELFDKLIKLLPKEEKFSEEVNKKLTNKKK